MSWSPLSYQTSEYDCGAAAVLNAIKYVLETTEIPPVFLKQIYGVCLDEFDENGLTGGRGTSRAALCFLTEWFNSYSKILNFPLECFFFIDEAVFFATDSPLVKMLDSTKRTAVVTKCLLWDEHYITLTGHRKGLEQDNLLLFDAYYWDIDYQDDRILRIDDPFRANRMIPVEFMETTEGKFYNIREIPDRVAMVFRHK